MKNEMIEKAKQAQTPEELLMLAKENGTQLTEEEAGHYFRQLHPTIGELSDDELDDVSGGGCETNGGYTTVTSDLKCFNGQYQNNFWRIQYANGEVSEMYMQNDSNASLRKTWKKNCSGDNRCGRCAHLEFNGGIGYCGVSK